MDRIEKKSEKSNKKRTFELDEELPSLPVPSLDETLDKYLDSIEPFVTESELKTTKIIVEKFRNGAGEDLQDLLLKHAGERKNWVRFICNN